MTKLSKFEIEGVREVDVPLFSGAPQIPLGEIERLDKETPREAQVTQLSSSGPGPGQVRVRKVRVGQSPAQRTQNLKI